MRGIGCRGGELPAGWGYANFLVMSDKEIVMETIRQMPEVSTLKQISEEIAILAALREGEAAADAGRVTPHEEVRRRVGSWISR